jgi:hypothetical protein
MFVDINKNAAIHILIDGRIQRYFTSNFQIILTSIWHKINTSFYVIF